MAQRWYQTEQELYLEVDLTQSGNIDGQLTIVPDQLFDGLAVLLDDLMVLLPKLGALSLGVEFLEQTHEGIGYLRATIVLKLQGVDLDFHMFEDHFEVLNKVDF